MIVLFFLILSNSFAKEKEIIFFQSNNLKLKAKVLVTGLNYPWSLAFLPNGHILVTEKVGKLRIIKKNFYLDPTPVQGLPVIRSSGQGGLFDIILHPDYKSNDWIYFSYNGKNGRTWGTELARAKLKNQHLTNLQVLFRLEPKTKSNRHFGGKIIFDEKNFLFLTTGDRGERKRAQNINDHAGSIIRLLDNGQTPVSNPFYGSDEGKDEIYSFGHRNIQGLDISPLSGELFAHEHGPQGGDELNIIKPGANYGWPIVTFGVNYGIGSKIGIGIKHKGMKNPIYKWVPSIATSGMTFITGNHFKEWAKDILIGSLKAQKLVKIRIMDGRVTDHTIIIDKLIGRIRNVKIGPDGYIYILTDEKNGKLIQISKQ